MKTPRKLAHTLPRWIVMGGLTVALAGLPLGLAACDDHDSMKDTMHDAKGDVKDAAHDAKENIKDAGKDVKDAANDAADKIKDKADDVHDKME